MRQLQPGQGPRRADNHSADRLVKELRLAGACDMEAGNALLPDFLDRFNKRFAIPAASAENLLPPES